jgi:hypothetical protein
MDGDLAGANQVREARLSGQARATMGGGGLCLRTHVRGVENDFRSVRDTSAGNARSAVGRIAQAGATGGTRDLTRPVGRNSCGNAIALS